MNRKLGKAVEDQPGDRHPEKLTLSGEDVFQAIMSYVALDSLEEARSVYSEAHAGNMVAQYILGMSLLKAGRKQHAHAWLTLSADQSFEPAKQNLTKAGYMAAPAAVFS